VIKRFTGNDIGKPEVRKELAKDKLSKQLTYPGYR